MPKVELFISSTDFATLKNDGTTDFTLTVPGGTVIAGSGQLLLTQDQTVGVKGASTRTRIASSKNANRFLIVPVMSMSRQGLVIGNPAFYEVIAYVSRVGPTQLRASVIIRNPYSDSLTCAGGDETFSFHVNTFVPPFA